mmetsp:Transcript_68991/g.173776  ORF Transcript_68991/g.173776 Transcript_68991/m.173776 type:complete len:295 (-) Transcript_68991:1242-2126(-)
MSSSTCICKLLFSSFKSLACRCSLASDLCRASALASQSAAKSSLLCNALVARVLAACKALTFESKPEVWSRLFSTSACADVREALKASARCVALRAASVSCTKVSLALAASSVASAREDFVFWRSDWRSSTFSSMSRTFAAALSMTLWTCFCASTCCCALAFLNFSFWALSSSRCCWVSETSRASSVCLLWASENCFCASESSIFSSSRATSVSLLFCLIDSPSFTAASRAAFSVLASSRAVRSSWSFVATVWRRKPSMFDAAVRFARTANASAFAALTCSCRSSTVWRLSSSC